VRCLFRELHAANDFTELSSAADPHWLIGFNRRGSRLPADRWLTQTTARQHHRRSHRRRHRRCYQFIKTDQRPASASRDLLLTSRGQGSSAGAPAPLIDYAAWYDRLASRLHHHNNATSR